MNWICYIFKKGTHVYLVAEGSEENAWIKLAKRQSMSLENCQKQYTYCGFMNENSDVWKL